MTKSISAYFEDQCQIHAERVAVYDGNDTPVSFKILFLTMMSFSTYLIEQGVRAGDRVSIELSDAINSNLLRFALLRIGAEAMPTSKTQMKGLFDLDVKWRIHINQNEPPSAFSLIFDKNWLVRPDTNIPISGQGLILRSTSGSTGTPKLRAATGQLILERALFSLEHRGSPDGPILTAYAPNSTPGMNHFFKGICSGQAQVFQGQTPSVTLQRMCNFGVKYAYLSPYSFNQLLDTAMISDDPTPKLKQIWVGGGAVSCQVALKGEECFGAEVLNSYGSNETGSLTSSKISQMPDITGVVGYPCADKAMKIIVGGEHRKGTEEVGEIWVQVPPKYQVTTYPSMKSIYDADGWIFTGDIGKFLPDGQLCLLGRSSELLNVGGNKVAPSAIEKIASYHPLVESVIAFRAPILNGTDNVGIAVKGRSGFNINDFGKFMFSRLGPTFPLQITVIDAIPVTKAGKVDRKALTDGFLYSQQTGADVR